MSTGRQPERRRKVDKNTEIRRQQKAARAFKLWLIRVTIISSMIFLSYKVIEIKIEYGDEYEQRAIAQLINAGSESDMAINPNRGAIMDRNKMPIAVSSTEYKVFLDVKMLLERAENDNKEADPPEDTIRDTFLAINEVFGTPLEQLYTYVAYDEAKGEYTYGKHQYLVFETGVKMKAAQDFKDLKTKKVQETGRVLRDVYLEAVSIRSYLYGTFASQLIGFNRGDSSWGLERQYNASLTGTPGRIYESFSVGGFTTETVDAVEGNTLITTIDFQLQQEAEMLCAKYAKVHNSPNTSMIVMDPHTGEVLAMAQSPGFDLNDPSNLDLFTDQELAASIGNLEQGAAFDEIFKVWKNFNITSTFEPGSIFKPVTIAAALEEGIVKPGDTFYCGGHLTYAGHQIHCHKTSGHGSQTLEESLMNSCNVALMKISETLGRELFYKYQHDFGYGEKTGIDLPAEESCANLLHKLSGLNASELATGSFGQRFKCTPIQAITSFAAVINGGILYKPYVVSQIIDSSGNIVSVNSPTIMRKVISRETSDYLRETMQMVVSPSGTGRLAEIPGYAIGGKTGTGEQGIKDEDGNVPHSVSFIGYLPVDNPQYLVLALIDNIPPEHFKEGQTSAAPMIKEMFSYLIAAKGILPSDANEAAISTNKVIVGDYVGSTLPEAAQMINENSLNFEFIGNAGTVIESQTPEAGSIVMKDTTIWLTITTDGDYTLKTVPSLVGLDPAVAEAILVDEGFTPLIVYESGAQAEESEDSQLGEISLPDDMDSVPLAVHSQSPKAGVMVVEGMVVKLRIK